MNNSPENSNIEEVIEAEVKRRREWLTEHYGERCEEYEFSCILCDVWLNQDLFEDFVNPKDNK